MNNSVALLTRQTVSFALENFIRSFGNYYNANSSKRESYAEF